MKNLIPAIQFDQQDLPSNWYAQKKRNWETQERFRRPSSCLKITAGTEIWHAFSTTSNPLDSGWLGCLIASITKVIGSLGLGKTCEIEIRLNLSIPPNISPFFCFQNFESAERLFSHLLSPMNNITDLRMAPQLRRTRLKKMWKMTNSNHSRQHSMYDIFTYIYRIHKLIKWYPTK